MNEEYKVGDRLRWRDSDLDSWLYATITRIDGHGDYQRLWGYWTYKYNKKSKHERESYLYAHTRGIQKLEPEWPKLHDKKLDKILTEIL